LSVFSAPLNQLKTIFDWVRRNFLFLKSIFISTVRVLLFFVSFFVWCAFHFYLSYYLNNLIFKIDLEQERISSSSSSNNSRINRIEKLDDNRTIIHVGESQQSHSNTQTVTDIINRFNTLNQISDGQYTFTNDNPPILFYHLRLPFETLMDGIRIQSDPELNLLKIFIEQQERNLIEEQNEKLIVRSTSRVCRLPKNHIYDYNNLRVNFLNDNFIRIEIPTLN